MITNPQNLGKVKRKKKKKEKKKKKQAPWTDSNYQ